MAHARITSHSRQAMIRSKLASVITMELAGASRSGARPFSGLRSMVRRLSAKLSQRWSSITQRFRQAADVGRLRRVMRARWSARNMSMSTGPSVVGSRRASRTPA